MASGSSSSRADHSAAKIVTLALQLSCQAAIQHNWTDFKSSAIVVTNPTYEFDVARILLILMRPAIRNRRAERFRISVGHCGANDIGRECRRWCISRLRALIPSMHCRLAEEVP